MSKVIKDMEKIDLVVFNNMLKSAEVGLETIGKAKLGDKTLMDTLIPAVEAYEKALVEDISFSEALEVMKLAAEDGKESTRDLVARNENFFVFIAY